MQKNEDMRGPQGERGRPGRSLSWAQGLVLFLLVVLVVVLLSIRSTHQQNQIRDNTEAIRGANYQSCLGANVILDRFNMQQDALAAIEQDLAEDPAVTPAGKRAAEARVKAYNAAKTLPLPTCVR